MVADRGIDPTDAKPGVDAAIVDAKIYLAAHPDITLVFYFPAGTYLFKHPLAPAISFSNITTGKLTFRGESPIVTKLAFAQFDQRGFDIQASNFVTIERMELTRTEIYTTQGDVTQVSPGHVRFQVQTGFPDPVTLVHAPNAQNNERTLMHFRGDPLDPELAPNSWKIEITDVLSLGAGQYDAILRDATQLADLQIGDQVALKAKVGDKTVSCIDCNDFTVQDTTITRSSGVPILVGGASDHTTLKNVAIARSTPINGHTPFFSGAAGGPQLTANSYGPTVEGCTITATADDALALYAYNSASIPSGAVVENNFIRDAHGRSMNITESINGLITNNTIIRGANASIQMRLSSNGNGIVTAAVKGWTISNNTFIQSWSYPVIFLNKDGANIVGGLHTGIKIVGNNFLLAPKDNPLIQIENSDEVEIENNTIISFSTEDDYSLAGIPMPAPLVYVPEGLNVHGTGNTFKTPATRPVSITKPGSNASIDWTLSP